MKPTDGGREADRNSAHALQALAGGNFSHLVSQMAFGRTSEDAPAIDRFMVKPTRVTKISSSGVCTLDPFTVTTVILIKTVKISTIINICCAGTRCVLLLLFAKSLSNA
jgi:hypothetical protein